MKPPGEFASEIVALFFADVEVDHAHLVSVLALVKARDAEVLSAARRYCATCPGEVTDWHEDETCVHCKDPVYRTAGEAITAAVGKERSAILDMLRQAANGAEWSCADAGVTLDVVSDAIRSRPG